MTSPTLKPPLCSLREALDETLASIDCELDAVRRLYGVIEQHYRRVLELRQRVAMLKAEIHRGRRKNASTPEGDGGVFLPKHDVQPTKEDI
jgi:hypothetical protein